jgi:hypothetical protein
MTDVPATLFDRPPAAPASAPEPAVAPAPAATASPAPAGPPPGPPPASLPGSPKPEGQGVIKVGDAEFTETELQELAAFKATEAVRKMALPPAPENYELMLPADLALPEGVSFEFQTEDPILGPVIKQAQAFAHANGFTQDQFSGMMGLYAASQAHEQATLRSYHAAEVTKLGPAGSARVDAVTTWMNATVGADHAKALQSMLVTAKIVEGFEKLIQKSIGGGGFSQQHRESQQIGPTGEEFSSWSFAEQREFQNTGKYPNRSSYG